MSLRHQTRSPFLLERKLSERKSFDFARKMIRGGTVLRVCYWNKLRVVAEEADLRAPGLPRRTDRALLQASQARSGSSHRQDARTGKNHDCHRYSAAEPVAPSDRATMGRSVQLLRQRLPLGPDVCAYVPLLAFFCPSMPESAPLARQPPARRKHRAARKPHGLLPARGCGKHGFKSLAT